MTSPTRAAITQPKILLIRFPINEITGAATINPITKPNDGEINNAVPPPNKKSNRK